MAVSPEGSGTATDETDEGPCEEGASVSIKAEANPGYQFVNWTATAGFFEDEDAAETTFTMPGEDVTVTANFRSTTSVTQYTLTVQVEGQGSTTPSTGVHTYNAGTVVNLTATPSSGWQFDGWQGDVDSEGDTVTMDASKSVTAVFSRISTPYSPPGGGVTYITVVTQEEPEPEPVEEVVIEVPEEPAVQPETEPEPEEEIVVVPEEPEAAPELPRTGSPDYLIWGLGTLLAGAGTYLKRSRRR